VRSCGYSISVPTYDVETWGDRDFKRFHMIIRVNGRIVAEMLYPQDRTGGVTLGKVDPSYTALWTGYRQALKDGSARIERSGRLHGRDVYWLTFSQLGRSPTRTEVAIDRKTYEPLDFRDGVQEGKRPVGGVPLEHVNAQGPAGTGVRPNVDEVLGCGVVCCWHHHRLPVTAGVEHDRRAELASIGSHHAAVDVDDIAG